MGALQEMVDRAVAAGRVPGAVALVSRPGGAEDHAPPVPLRNDDGDATPAEGTPVRVPEELFQGPTAVAARDPAFFPPRFPPRPE